MYEPIIDALRRGAADEALAAAREATAAQPQDPAAHRLLGAALRLGGDREGAIVAIDQAIELAPDDATLHMDRAGLLLLARQLDQAEVALAQSIGLDPNQFPAYIMQAQLALGRGDLDEAERLTRTAARIAPAHPQIAALEGSVALRRGDADRALVILSQADEQFPDEPILRHALAFAYLAKGHFAFAEQAFRTLLESAPDTLSLRAMVAHLVARQGRPADAAAELAPALEGPAATPALRRMLGEIELQAGHHQRAAELLREALIAQPGDRRALLAATEAWHRLDAADDARATLDRLLDTHPQYLDLWRARLAFETFAGDAAAAVIARWRAASPDSVAAMQAQIAVHDVAGEAEQAEALARRIVELQPGHAQAELRIVDALLARDPAAAVRHIEAMIAGAGDDVANPQLRQLLGVARGVAGEHAAAVATWAALHAEMAPRRAPLPPTSAPRNDWPALATPEPGAAPTVFLWGAPGSLVERLAVTLDAAGGPLRADRFGTRAPADLFQRYTTIDTLANGSADPAALVAEWRAALPARGIPAGQPIFDWLPWWDNAALLALRPHLPGAQLVIALRDPRDMLLDWLAWLASGTPSPFALQSPEAGAQWLARVLSQLADLHEGNLLPHRLLRLDTISDDPAGIAQALGAAFEVQLPTAPAARFGGRRFPAGHWRVYAEPLAAAFEALHPVARRLGYED